MDKSAEGIFWLRATVAYYVQKKSWKNLFAYMGPGFLVSIAYIDPGNCKISSFSILCTTFWFVVCLFYSIKNGILKVLFGYSQLRLIYNLEHSTSMGYVSGLFDIVILLLTTNKDMILWSKTRVCYHLSISYPHTLLCGWISLISNKLSMLLWRAEMIHSP